MIVEMDIVVDSLTLVLGVEANPMGIAIGAANGVSGAMRASRGERPEDITVRVWQGRIGGELLVSADSMTLERAWLAVQLELQAGALSVDDALAELRRRVGSPDSDRTS